MIPEEKLSDEVLRQAAEKYAEAIIASLPAPQRVQSQVFQGVRSKDADTAPAKDYLHHESRVYLQITRTAVIFESSPFLLLFLLQAE